jgi:bacteriorhodopsin
MLALLRLGGPGVGLEGLWLALGALLMLLGTGYFLGRGWSVGERARTYYAVAIGVTASSGVAYLAMLFGLGTVTVPIVGGDAVTLYWLRHIEWLVTTPLLVLSLCLVAGADRRTTATLLALDVFIMATGLLAALMRLTVARFVFWAISGIGFALLVTFLFTRLGPIARERRSERTRSFRTLRNLLVVLWSVYPVWWLLGANGIGLLPGELYLQALGFLVLDVLSKLVFCLVLVHSAAVANADAADSADTGDRPTAAMGVGT